MVSTADGTVVCKVRPRCFSVILSYISKSNAEVNYLAKKKANDYGTGIPEHEVEALARVLLPEIRKFFESEEGQQEFQKWKERQKVGNK